ncbi:MAG: major capsid protein [Bacteroidota bacterium]
MAVNNPKQTRVVDPINTEVVRGYKNADFVGMSLFPAVPVSQYGGQVIEFGKEAFILYASNRARGAGTKRVRFGYEGKPFVVIPSSLEGVVPFEDMVDADQVPGIDLSRGAVGLTMRSLTLGKEYQAAKLATDPNNYGADNKVALAGGDKWSAAGSKPADQINEAKRAIRKKIGVEPNTLVLSGDAFDALKENASLLDKIKYTQRGSITTEIIAAAFDVERVLVGKAVYADNEAADFSDVWGNNAVLAYVPANASMRYAPGSDGAMMNREEPSYGYSYVVGGMPMVEQPYQDRNAKSWIYPVTYDATPVLSGVEAGYLFQNPL